MADHLPFEVIDRRGQKKEPREVPVVIEPELDSDNTSWEDVSYMVVLAQGQRGPMVIGRAIGLRADGLCVLADWIFPASPWKAGTDWTEFAGKRLETYLGCKCRPHHMCADHAMYSRQWMEADADRINRGVQEPVPKAVEVWMKAEMARRQTGLVVPGAKG